MRVDGVMERHSVGNSSRMESLEISHGRRADVKGGVNGSVRAFAILWGWWRRCRGGPEGRAVRGWAADRPMFKEGGQAALPFGAARARRVRGRMRARREPVDLDRSCRHPRLDIAGLEGAQVGDDQIAGAVAAELGGSTGAGAGESRVQPVIGSGGAPTPALPCRGRERGRPPGVGSA